jgi:cell division transport system ATP-binding protein
MIRLHRVCKFFDGGPMKLPALSDITFEVDKGDFVVLSGASGAGKTTLLRLLYADERATDGEIEVAGFDVMALRRREVPLLRRSLGIVFQDSKLLSGRTVFENIAFVLRVLGTPRRDITPRAFQALKAVGLSSCAQAYPAQLSQGEGQRAALARAIVRSPALLLADEPTGNLDEEMASEILDLIKDIWSRGTTVLLATHQSRLAAQLKRRTVRLEDGILIKDEG